MSDLLFSPVFKRRDVSANVIMTAADGFYDGQCFLDSPEQIAYISSTRIKNYSHKVLAE